MSHKGSAYARELLRKRGVPLNQDFHRLDSATAEAVLQASREYGYRKSPSAPGSTARMFYRFAHQGMEVSA